MVAILEIKQLQSDGIRIGILERIVYYRLGRFSVFRSEFHQALFQKDVARAVQAGNHPGALAARHNSY